MKTVILPVLGFASIAFAALATTTVGELEIYLAFSRLTYSTALL